MGRAIASLPPESPAPLLPTPPGNFRPSPHTSQHGLLLLGGADEAADALDDLALGIYLLFSRFLAQEDGGNWKASKTTSITALGKAATPLLSLIPTSPSSCGKGRGFAASHPFSALPSSGDAGGANQIFVLPPPSTSLSLSLGIFNCVTRT